jgi:DNA-binding ferritin-like protein
MNHEPLKKVLAMLMCGQICLRLIHWNTTSYAEHKAIGKLYDNLADLTDTLAETYMGIYGRFGNIPCSHNELPDAAAYVSEMGNYIQAMRAELPNDTQLQNIVDEIASAIDTTNYLLTLK